MFFDETSIKTNMTPLWGGGLCGERLLAGASFGTKRPPENPARFSFAVGINVGCVDPTGIILPTPGVRLQAYQRQGARQCMREVRIAVIFRADLEMPHSKSEVQFGHAIATLMHVHSDAFYMAGKQMKLSMEVDDEEGFYVVARNASARRIPYVIITGAGRTVFIGPTVTCIAVGPMDKTDCNAITRAARMRA